MPKVVGRSGTVTRSSWAAVGMLGVLAAMAVAGMIWLGAEAVGHVAVLEAAPEGSRIGWNNAVTWFVALEAASLLWIVFRWVTWRPGGVPGRAGRRLPSRAKETRDPEERHPALTLSGWAEVLFLLIVLVPGSLYVWNHARSAKPAYDDRRQALVVMARQCPALRPELEAMVSKGVPSMEEVAAMRVRVKVVAQSPLKGQVCSTGDAS